MRGEVVSVWLNGELVVDGVVMENYWDHTKPIAPQGPIELQHHGNPIEFRNIYIKELRNSPDVRRFGQRARTNWPRSRPSGGRMVSTMWRR